MFTILEHTADVGFAFAGPDLAGAYREAARALTWLLVGDAPVASSRERRVRLDAPDPADRLFDLLSDIVYRFDAEHFLVADVRLEGDEAVLAGEAYDRERHGPVQTYVKAVTYHQLRLACHDGRCEGQVYVDI